MKPPTSSAATLLPRRWVAAPAMDRARGDGKRHHQRSALLQEGAAGERRVAGLLCHAIFSAARITARRIRTWVPHLHRFPARACRTWSSVGPFCRREERGRLHDHAVDAVAALSCLFVDECLLHRMRLFGRPKTFQGHDLGVGYRRNRHHAAAQRLAVIVHRTGAALRQPAPEVHAVQAKLVAQRVQQGHAGIVGFQDAALPLTDSLMVSAKMVLRSGRRMNARAGLSVVPLDSSLRALRLVTKM